MQIPERRMRQHIYPDVGRCIYCGSDGGVDGLRIEHIIPGGLGGRLELPKASCLKCEKETSAFEGRVLGSIYGDARAHFGVRRERKRTWPDKLPVLVSDDSGGSWTVEVPINEHPNLFFAIKLLPPRLLSGVPPDDSGFHNVLADGMGDRDIWRRAAKIAIGKRVGLSRGGGVHVDEFGRFLAKIGHSYVAAEIGANCFKPFLVNAILNKRPMYLGHYIGGSSIHGSQQPDVHELSLRKQRIGDREIWITRVHLFADIGVVGPESPNPTSMPAYDVAVGEAMGN